MSNQYIHSEIKKLDAQLAQFPILEQSHLTAIRTYMTNPVRYAILESIEQLQWAKTRKARNIITRRRARLTHKLVTILVQ